MGLLLSFTSFVSGCPLSFECSLLFAPGCVDFTEGCCPRASTPAASRTRHAMQSERCGEAIEHLGREHRLPCGSTSSGREVVALCVDNSSVRGGFRVLR